MIEEEKLALENEAIKNLARTTLQVAKEILDNEDCRDWKEARMCFLSIWVGVNDAYKLIADIMESTDVKKQTKEKFEGFYKSFATAMNTPLFVRIPQQLQGKGLAENAEKARVKTKAPGPVVISGYNDKQSLKEWSEHYKSKQDVENE